MSIFFLLETGNRVIWRKNLGWGWPPDLYCGRQPSWNGCAPLATFAPQFNQTELGHPAATSNIRVTSDQVSMIDHDNFSSRIHGKLCPTIGSDDLDFKLIQKAPKQMNYHQRKACRRIFAESKTLKGIIQGPSHETASKVPLPYVVNSRSVQR